jgi:polysaccharide chain length determinant protein (PEP-CTERM system associated)
MREDVQFSQISAEVVDRRTGRPTAATIAFTLSYMGKDTPAKIQRVANVLTSLFLKENLEVRERQTSETSKFLEEEMQRVKRDLNTTENALADFKMKHINSLPEMLQVNMQGVSMSERSIERLDEQLRSLKEREGYLQTQLANISPYMENSDRQRLEALETELVALQTRFSAEHPDVIKAKAEIAALKSKMDDDSDREDADGGDPDNPAYVTLASQLASTRADIKSVGNQIRELRKEKAKYDARIEETPRVEREYQVLIAEQLNLKAKYNDLMQKHMESVVALGLEKGQKGERFTLIDPPQLPEKPFKPNRLAIALIGIVLGIGAGVGWAALREFNDQAVYSGERLAAGSGFPVLGEVPAIMTAEDYRRKRTRRVVTVSVICIALIGGVILFHYLVMDWWVFWAKLNRRLML